MTYPDSGRSATGRAVRLPGKAQVSRLATGCATLTLAFCLAQGIGATVALASVRPFTVTNYGSFKLTGAVSGSLVPLAGTCDASNSAADIEFSWFGKVTTLKDVSAKSIVSFELDLQGSRYDKAGKLTNTDGSPPFFTFNATTGKGLPLDWQSTSGTYYTSKGGVSGTVDVVLDQADGKPGTVVVKGSWAHCRVGGNI
ncbi:MAG TPA: hypothetical protein VEJ84_21675 [Acidimicrobiales bacterium]|nr:hypothetical protein [Acidimicrobiales bacterium]